MLTGCMDESIAAKLFSKCGGKEKCTQHVNVVTTFKWDKVYIFHVETSLDHIEKVLGFPYKQWTDIGDRIIFVYKDQVVYHEEYFPYPEHIEEGRTFFELNKASYSGVYNTATFLVSKEENDNGEWYYRIITTE